MPLRNVLSAFILLLLSFLIASPLIAQEIDCTVQVNYEAVPTTNKDLLRDFASDIRDYLNNYKWGQDNIGEKVKCTMNIFIQSVTGENKYLAQLFVGSQRKIFGTEKTRSLFYGFLINRGGSALDPSGIMMEPHRKAIAAEFLYTHTFQSLISQRKIGP